MIWMERMQRMRIRKKMGMERNSVILRRRKCKKGNLFGMDTNDWEEETRGRERESQVLSS